MNQLIENFLGNAIGGLVAAIVYAGLSKLWDFRRNKILKELVIIMGKAIQHRNEGKSLTLKNEDEWISEAKRIEEESQRTAHKLSYPAGKYVEWLDKIEPYPANDDRARYVSILSKTIERIRELILRNA